MRAIVGIGRIGWMGEAAPCAILLVLAVLTFGACATTDAVQTVQEDSRLTHSMVLGLGEAAQELRRDVTQLRRQLQELRDEFTGTIGREEARRQETIDALREQLTSVEERVEALAGAIGGVEMSVGGLSDQVARLEALPPTAPESAVEAVPKRMREATPGVARATVVPATAPPADSPAEGTKPRGRSTNQVAAEELFGRARESFEEGELGQAILDFEDFLGRNPSHPLAGSARFWIGEAYYKARDYEHAAAEYQKAVEVAPKGESTPEALLKMGLAYRALKRHDRAREAWTRLVEDFPQSDAAQKARIALRGAASSGPSRSN